MLSRLAGATVRATIVAMVIMAPVFMFPDTSQFAFDISQIFAFIAAAVVIYEYAFPSPSILEFRYLPPYNRLRFAVFAICILCSGHLIATLPYAPPGLVNQTAHFALSFTDFNYSPIRVVADILHNQNDVLNNSVAFALAFNTLVAVLFIMWFSLYIFTKKRNFYRENFNIWLNVPMSQSYDITRFRKHLIYSASTSLLFAGAVVLFGPLLAKYTISWFSYDGSLTSITLVWFSSVWVYLPAIYTLRAVMLFKLAFDYADYFYWAEGAIKDS